MAVLERIHVLLIGIDVYQGVASLFGCVNDVEAIQKLLETRLEVPSTWIRRLISPRTDTGTQVDDADKPTLANLRRELALLAGPQVGPDDRVFIYYSGHGTQARLKAKDGTRFFREALVPSDTGDERRLLFDWELNAALAAIAARTRNITFVIDSCCSAGVTRALTKNVAAVPSPERHRRFCSTPEDIAIDTIPEALWKGRGVARGSVLSCQVVAACEDDETADEGGNGAVANGALTRAFLDALSSIPDAELPSLRWGRIWRPMLGALRTSSPHQHPWRSGGDARLVFGGPPVDGDAGIPISRVAGSYRIESGEVSGVTEGALIGVYGAEPLVFPVLGSDEDVNARRGTLRVVKSNVSTADAVAEGAPPTIEPTSRGRLVEAGKLAKLRVALSLHDEVLERVLAESSLVVVTGEPADVTVTGVGDQWAFVDDVFGDGTSAEEPTFLKVSKNEPRAVRRWLESYFEYAAPIRLARSCGAQPAALQIRLLDCKDLQLKEEQSQDPPLSEAGRGDRFSYELRTGARICIQVRNSSSLHLRTSLFVCQTDGKVVLLGEKNSIRANGSHVFWLEGNGGVPIVASVPAGSQFVVDRLVAIGTTAEGKSLRFLARNSVFRSALLELKRIAPAPARSQAGEALVPPAEEWRSALATVCTRR